MDIDLSQIRLPKKLNINYDEHISQEEDGNRVQREVVISTGKQHVTSVNEKPKENVFQ